MSNKDIVEKFLTCYQVHDFHGMHDCLDENVAFSDFAFDIQGKAVKAMWHWFCISYSDRTKPIDVPEFEVLEPENNVVLANYRVSYLYRKKMLVDYFIKTHFRLQNNKIIEQKDAFKNISEYEFAEMAFGFPLQLLALTPLLRMVVKKEAAKKLKQFMKDYEYQEMPSKLY